MERWQEQEREVLKVIFEDSQEVWADKDFSFNKKASPYYKKNQYTIKKLYQKGLLMKDSSCCGVSFYMITDSGKKEIGV